MMSKLFQWFENIWNLRKIFDKYLPQIRELVETVKKLQQQIAELKSMKEELENGILLLKQSNDTSQQDTEEMTPFIGCEEKPITTSKKVDEWYDADGNGGWDIEINKSNK